ncbi:hypothetical protein MNBD_ALPHA11-1734 [hydrothermal vent metagenome]|uniref:Uncharacterized protein n=1 Tax=hydrothermal vent metagenome TaxID=652676 RepID=A0A3B0TXE5_9ZZZZ
MKFNLFSVEGFVVSDNYTIDEDFGGRNNVEVLAPFKFQIPRQDNVTPLFTTGTGSGGMIIKVNFTTGDKDTDINDRQFIENMQFVSMVLPLGEPEERIAVLTGLLRNDVFNSATAAYEQKELLGSRNAKIGDLDVVDVVGRYIDPDLGLVYVRMVGFPNPDGPDAVFSVSNILAERFDFTSLDDLEFTGGGKALSSFEYIKP